MRMLIIAAMYTGQQDKTVSPTTHAILRCAGQWHGYRWLQM